VNDDRDPFFSATPTRVFTKQMEYIASRFTVCSLEEAVERLKRNDIPENAVVVTFDDGYKDNYMNAFPILKSLSIPATIFLTTDAIGSGNILWHDKVFSIFRENKVDFLEGFGTSSMVFPLRTLEEKLFAQKEVLKFLRSLNDYERLFWIDRLAKKLHFVDRREPSDIMLTWDEVKVMHHNGIHFGSHTVSHPILSRSYNNRIILEISESKKVIEENIGILIKTFAYPNGKKEDFNEKIKAILKEYEYTCALTTIFGTNENDQDLFELRRATPWDNDICAFGVRFNCYKFFS
jgi:peptidoglycan/xylan/chitin deacetylase (PgdA/CDA1 family)